LGWPWTVSLLISASQVARIIGMSHLAQFQLWSCKDTLLILKSATTKNRKGGGASLKGNRTCLEHCSLIERNEHQVFTTHT
jgi:hypothetical protein